MYQNANQSKGFKGSRIGISRVAAIYGGDIALLAGSDISIQAAQLGAAGSVVAQAGRDLSLSSLSVGYERDSRTGTKDYLSESQYQDIGSRIEAQGNIQLSSGNNITVQAGSINSQNGALSLNAGSDISILAGKQTQSFAASYSKKDKHFLGASRNLDQYSKYQVRALPSELTAAQININAGNNIQVTGSQIIADQDLTLLAGRGINIHAAEESSSGGSVHIAKKSGLMGSDGLGFSIGGTKETAKNTRGDTHHAASTVGSLQGDTRIIAAEKYSQIGSIVSSPEGDILIQAKQIGIESVDNQYRSEQQQTFERKGLTIAVNVPVLQAIQGAMAATEKTGESGNARVNAMAAANAAAGLYKAGSSLASAAQAPQKAAQDVSVSITYGEQRNSSETKIHGNTAAGSSIQAGGKAVLIAGGDQKNSNINIIGSDVAGKQGTYLIADNEINILAADQNHSERSTNKSAGWNAGVAISYGQSGMSLGVTAGGNMGRGYGNGDETTYRNSRVGDSGSQTQIQSGGATNIIGGQIIGKGVQLDASELNITSLQDTAVYKGKQQNIEGQVTVGYGVSASGSYSQSKINAGYAAVNEQSGIFAGDDGYQIQVKGNTDLKGALITSTDKAEADRKNTLSTGTLTHSDLYNHADYEGESFGISGSGSVGGGNAPKEIGGVQLAQQGTNTTATNPTTGATETKGAVDGSKAIGFGSDSGHDSSTTRSGINTANITITDKEQQQTLTGKTAEETIAGIQTKASTEDYAQHTGSLKNNFDKEKVLAELNLQVEVTQKFGETAQSMIDAYTLPKQEELREKIKATKNEAEKTELYEEIYQLQYKKRFLETLVGIVAADPTAAVTQGTLQLAATKMREETLENSRKSPGIVVDDKGTVVNNVSYDSGYFDGVKLGGVRVSLDIICGQGNERCDRDSKNNLKTDANGNYKFKPTDEYPTYQSVLDDKKESGDLYGQTGGFQPIEGGWYLPGGMTISYKPGSFSDKLVESFAGTHDLLSGQIWGWYGKDGNTSRNRNSFEKKASGATTVIAIPVSAPFALSDLISSDVMQLILKLGK